MCANKRVKEREKTKRNEQHQCGGEYNNIYKRTIII